MRVSLPEDGRSDRRQLEVRVQEVFRPFTLLLWGTAEETRIRDLIIDHDHQLLATIPGCLFESELSFAEFEKLLVPRHPFDGCPVIPENSVRELGLIFRLDLPTVTPAGVISLDIEGPFTHGVFLGQVPGIDQNEDSFVLPEGLELIS